MNNKDIYKRQKRTYEISNGFVIPNIKQRKLNIHQYEEIATFTKFEQKGKENKNKNKFTNFLNPFINNLNSSSNLNKNSINSDSENSENSGISSQNSTINDILEGISLVNLNKKDEIMNEMFYNDKLKKQKIEENKNIKNSLIKESLEIFNLKKNKNIKLEIKKNIKTIKSNEISVSDSRNFFEKFKENKIKTNPIKPEKNESIDIKKKFEIIQEACGKYKNFPMNHSIKFNFQKKEPHKTSRNNFSIKNSFNSETQNSFNESSKNFNSSKYSDKSFSYFDLMTEKRKKIKDCFSSVNLHYNIDIKNAFKNIKVSNNPEKEIPINKNYNKINTSNFNSLKEINELDNKLDKNLENFDEISPISNCSKISKDSFKVPLYSKKRSRKKDVSPINLDEKRNITGFNEKNILIKEHKNIIIPKEQNLNKNIFSPIINKSSQRDSFKINNLQESIKYNNKQINTKNSNSISPKVVSKYQTPKFNEIKENMNVKQIEKIIDDNSYLLLRNRNENYLNKNIQEFEYKKIDYKIQK